MCAAHPVAKAKIFAAVELEFEDEPICPRVRVTWNDSVAELADCFTPVIVRLDAAPARLCLRASKLLGFVPA
jgi:hypothetical protein